MAEMTVYWVYLAGLITLFVGLITGWIMGRTTRGEPVAPKLPDVQILPKEKVPAAHKPSVFERNRTTRPAAGVVRVKEMGE